MHLEHAEHQRDLRLRRRMLQLMHAARVRPESGWMTGRLIVDVLEGAGSAVSDDEHATGLLRDLVGAGLADERDDRTRRPQRPCLDLTSYRISVRGVALLEERIAPDPLVDDERTVNGPAGRAGTTGER
jgi:hypothetical protein